jgi:U3 small nucleolar ribonucleoprotein component
MAKKVNEYRKDIEKALKAAGKYSRSLGAQILSLAGALRTLDLANDEIDGLESTTITATSRYGNETLAPHPVFKIQKDAQDSVTRQMKALGLTAEELTGTDEDDPMIELTKKVKNAGRRKPNIVKRDAIDPAV